MKDEKQDELLGKWELCEDDNGGYEVMGYKEFHVAYCSNLKMGKKIVDDHNSLSGIPDPQEFVEAAKELLEKMELLLGEASWPIDYEHNQDVIDDSKNAITRFEKALGKV